MSGRYGGDIKGKRRSGRRKRDWLAPRVAPRPTPRLPLQVRAGTLVAAYGMYLVTLAGTLLTGA